MSPFDHEWAEDERRLRENLQRLAQTWVPRNRDLWPAIQAQLPASASPSCSRSPLRLRWALLLIVLITFSFTGLIHALDLWSRLPLIRSFEESDQTQVLALRETQEGITAILEQIYADANVILIAYRFHTSLPARGEPYQIFLQDAEGRVLPYIGGEGIRGSSDILRLSLPPGEVAFVAAFDPWVLPGWPVTQPVTRTLRLTIHWLPDIPEQSIPGLPPEPDRSVPWRVSPPAESSILSFVFTFQARVLPGQLWERPQTVHAKGIPMTLMRWVRAPSGARARVCFPPQDLNREWSPTARWILRNDVISGEAIPIPGNDRARTCTDLLFLQQRRIGDVSDPGSLQVLELIGWDRRAPGAPPVRLPGPWIFSLTKP